MRPVVVAVTFAILLAGCGRSTAVVEGEPVATPYGGPMSLKQDFSDEASPLERSGAAGRALECEGVPYNGGSGDYIDSGLESVQGTAVKALANWLGNEAWAFQIPATGYRVEREDGDRTLLSYDVEGRTKIAFIAADGIRDHARHKEGWGVESWGQCDPAELPAKVTDALGIGVWENASGRRVPVTKVRSFQGAKHCSWEDITFLHLGPGKKESDQYVRDTGGEFKRFLATTYDDHARLPEGATDTGFRRDGRQLWLAPEKDAAYLVSRDDPGDVERWPAAEQPILCG